MSKMKVEVQVISKHTIKPSSPTPHHRRNYQLSFLDQISPPVYMPLILFFESNNEIKLSNTQKSDWLKTTLAETLTRFYPLAGRLIDNVGLDCNDEGVPYFEARVECQLSDVVTNPIPCEYNKFLPRELADADDVLFAVQVNFFECGGMAIGLCTSHKISDALSIVMMVTSWAATARGDSKIVCPIFESAKLFPPRNISGYRPNVGMTKDKIVTRRFVFENSKVAALRDKYTDNNNNQDLSNKQHDYPIRPTRVEALSAFIWNRYAAATLVKSGPEKIPLVLHAVNLRTRMDPPMPDYSFGNLYRIAIATPSMESGDECGINLVRQMRETIKKIDGGYVKKLQEGDEHLNFIIDKAERFRKGEMVTFNFTSLCRLPIYEADFGWGKPVRIGSARLTFKNLVTFMDTRSSDAVEAWINMDEEEMAKFEVDKEFLAYVSPTPHMPF